MSYRHSVGRSRFINEIIWLSKWHLPPCTPDIYLLSAHISGTRARADFAAVGSLCPPGFAPHYVAVQPGRCRRFIGTLLARIDYPPAHCEWRTRSEEVKVLLPIVRTRMRSCWKQFRDRSRGKDCDESARIRTAMCRIRIGLSWAGIRFGP